MASNSLTYWSVEFRHPATDEVIENKEFETLKKIAEHYKKIPEPTWRNIAINRSKIYTKFIKLTKLKRERQKEQEEEEPEENDNQ